MQAEIRKKAQEISYIATKLAELSTRQEIASKVELACLNLIEKIYGQEYLSALEKTEVLEGLIAFSVNTGQTSIENGEELIKRTASLKDLLIEGYTVDQEESKKLEAKLELLPEPAKRPLLEVQPPTMGRQGKTRQSGNANKHKLPYDNQKTASSASGGPKAQERQAKIVNLLKEKGKLQLRDIISAFPETSERTIRYDLTALCNEQKLIREGNGGPANFYMLPTGITTSQIYGIGSKDLNKTKTTKRSEAPHLHGDGGSLEPAIEQGPLLEVEPPTVGPYPAPLPENAPVFEENTQETEQNFAE